MPTFTKTISTPDAARLVDAYCGLYGYQDNISTPIGDIIPNPESRAQFTDRMLTIRGFKEPIKRWETQEAKRIADEAADIDVT